MNKNKYLLAAFGILLIFFGWKHFIASDGSRNFKEVLIKLDTAAVSKINIVAKSNQFEPIEFTKLGDQWEVSNGTVKDEANQTSVRNILSAVVEMKPQRLVAKGKDKWEKYEVSDSTGTKAQFFNGADKVAELVIGKFSFNQNARSASTFIRQEEEDETYVVDGMLSTMFNQVFNNFRDMTFLTINKDNFTSLRYNYPADSSYNLSKVGDKWNINDQEADSTSVVRYLNGLSSIRPRDFNDNFSAEGKIATYRLTIEGNNMSAIKINGYQDGSELILHSSQNENAYFKIGTLGVFDKLFVPVRKLSRQE